MRFISYPTIPIIAGYRHNGLKKQYIWKLTVQTRLSTFYSLKYEQKSAIAWIAQMRIWIARQETLPFPWLLWRDAMCVCELFPSSGPSVY